MDTFYVELNGKTYEIAISEYKGLPGIAGQTPLQAHGLPLTGSVVVTPEPAGVALATAPVSGGGEPITAPLAGTILKVNVNNGQQVKTGDVLMSMEAMKMENEIMAHKDGIIASVDVLAGASVESGSLLCSIA